MIQFSLNGKAVQVDVPGDVPLLWVIREELGLKGTKYSCGKGLCGSCTVHLNGEAVPSCVIPVAMASGGSVTTIEGVTENGPHPVQEAWEKFNVPQCGYCQSGQIMKAISILDRVRTIQEDELFQSMDGNLCRCGTYNQIKLALRDAARGMGKLK